jgi:hypothetical protein
MALTTTIFVFGAQLLHLQPIFKPKHVLGAKFHKLSIFTCWMIFIFKMAEIFKMAFFKFFMIFLFHNMIYQTSISKSWKKSFNKKKQDGELIQDGAACGTKIL